MAIQPKRRYATVAPKIFPSVHFCRTHLATNADYARLSVPGSSSGNLSASSIPFDLDCVVHTRRTCRLAVTQCQTSLGNLQPNLPCRLAAATSAAA